MPGAGPREHRSEGCDAIVAGKVGGAGESKGEETNHTSPQRWHGIASGGTSGIRAAALLSGHPGIHAEPRAAVPRVGRSGQSRRWRTTLSRRPPQQPCHDEHGPAGHELACLWTDATKPRLHEHVRAFLLLSPPYPKCNNAVLPIRAQGMMQNPGEFEAMFKGMGGNQKKEGDK